MAILKIKNKKYERKSFIIHIKKILHMVQRYYAAVINLREVALDAAKQIKTEHDKWLVDELSTINSSDFIIT